MSLELLISIIALQRQTINKTEYRISIMKFKKLVTFFLLYKENKRNKIVKRKYWVSCLHSGWLPMERNLRKRNLRQPIKSSLLPYARFEFGSRDDLIG